MNSLEKFEIDDNLFMKRYYIPENICDNLINFYKSNSHLHYKGLSISGKEIKSDVSVKDSTDLSIEPEMNYFPMNEYRYELQKCLENYMEKYDILKRCSRFDITENYNIQHYKIEGGFKTWHFENDAQKNRQRILVFMTYLNDVEDGGTEFKYQGVTTPAKKGLTLLWPAGWTHLHKGQISKTKEKYIVTGWYSFLTMDEKNK
jgi:prolyl 4-hydroxylase